MKVVAVHAEEAIDFNRDIQPILSENCYHCHGPDANTREADLRLDTHEGALADLGGYQAIVPGDPEDSELYFRITSEDKIDVMPPRDSNRKLTQKEIKLIERWIKEGAKWSKHWSYRRVERPNVPEVKDTNWPTNNIDRFVLARLKAENLKPSPLADKRTLIRRVTLDLTGLPPTPEEVNAFLTDNQPGAYERVVDRLLASKAYGERMAWNWLDAARYADTNGYQGDSERTMWPWRDWVINAFNKNLPYDDFTLWQLAGDLLPNPTFEQRLATGFNRNHMINGEGGRIAEENRVEYVFDQVETTGTVWLGMTLNCCRCHDHKFDPIMKNDYYALFDYFNQTPVDGSGGNPQTPPVLTVHSEQQKNRIATLQGQIKKQQAERQTHEQALNAKQPAWEKTMLEAQGANAWRILHAESLKAEKQQLSKLEDGSILAGGPKAANDTYTVIYPLPAGPMTGLRLEALKHKSMTSGGLSRSGSSNFVLTGFELELQTPGNKTPLHIKDAQATFEQGHLKITKAFDGEKNTGWGVWNGRNVTDEHAAVFQLKDTVTIPDNAKLKVTLRHDSQHAEHILGRFRISTTKAQQPSLKTEGEDLINALQTPADKRNAKQKQLILNKYRTGDAQWAKLTDAIKQAQNEINKINQQAPKVMVMADRDKRRETYMLTKGLYNVKEETVTAHTPEFLPQRKLSEGQQENRLALARWIIDRDNPLTARVTVNRIWQQFWGIGLVKTTEDFGTQGERPYYPGLLDWLSVEFLDSGWDVKQLCKTIVMSSTYRQQSKVDATLHERDPENRLLARGARFRMPSWMIRDQALAASGLMNREMGGPSVNSYQPQGVWAEATFGKKKYQQAKGEDLYRRSLYTYWRRIVGPTMFFDSAKRQVCEVKPTRTNTPLHALATINDVTYVEAARHLAQTMLQANHKDDTARIQHIYLRILAREANPQELKAVLAMLNDLRTHFQADPAGAKALIHEGDSKPDEKLNVVDFASYTGVSLAIFNLDETLTKE